ncbi:MAG: hypothetical protein EZS28_046630, partial [Streblomastix strix]
KLDKNKGLEQYSKISMNSSYGSDGMNQEQFTDIKMCDRNETFRAHLYKKFKGDRKLADNVYAVEYEKWKFNCSTCIQVAYAVLDCANKFHFVQGDTDSMMLAVAGNPNKDYNQGFSQIITDQQFYDENFYKFFPDPSKGVYDEKKLLDVAYEHCGSSLIALAPKNYCLLEDFDKNHPQTVKLKGLNLKSNPQINKNAYEDNIRVKSQAQILDELLKRFDKTKKQIEIAEDSMKLSIQTILKQPKRLNLTEFVDEIQIQDNDNEIPVIIENADKIQYGGRTIQDCESI